MAFHPSSLIGTSVKFSKLRVAPSRQCFGLNLIEQLLIAHMARALASWMRDCLESKPAAPKCRLGASESKDVKRAMSLNIQMQALCPMQSFCPRP